MLDSEGSAVDGGTVATAAVTWVLVEYDLAAIRGWTLPFPPLATGTRARMEDHPEYKRTTATGGAAQDAPRQKLFSAYGLREDADSVAQEFS